ncbi:MAG: hypothetical protein NTY64_18805 [Deltaproteobacteria bacterium]|nr:hypothetical protein [Deltaproteobacteria bacterium]
MWSHPPNPKIAAENLDGFVKSPSAALRCILRRCGVPPSTPHSGGFARLASGAFYFAIQILTFYEFINLSPSGIGCTEKSNWPPAMSARATQNTESLRIPGSPCS